MLRDIRIFPIFEGANDVMRAFVALSGMKPVGEKLKGARRRGLATRSAPSACSPTTSPTGSSASCGRPGEEGAPGARELAEPIGDQVKRLRGRCGAQLREHKRRIAEKSSSQKRLSDAVSDIYGQIATLSRVSAIFEEQGVETSGQERYIAETFCTRAAEPGSDSNLDQVESNDDERMTAIAKLAYKRGEYGYAFFED